MVLQLNSQLQIESDRLLLQLTSTSTQYKKPHQTPHSMSKISIQQSNSRPTSTGSKKTPAILKTKVTHTATVQQTQGQGGVIQAAYKQEGRIQTSNGGFNVRSPPMTHNSELSPNPFSHKQLGQVSGSLNQSILTVNVQKVQKKPLPTQQFKRPNQAQSSMTTPEQPQSLSNAPSNKNLSTMLSTSQIKPKTTIVQKQRVNFSPGLPQQEQGGHNYSETVNRNQQPQQHTNTIMNKQIKNTKKHLQKEDQASQQLQRNLKMALHQLSENQNVLKTNPQNKMFNEIVERKQQSIVQMHQDDKRSHSEKINLKVKQTQPQLLKKKKTSSSIGSNQSKDSKKINVVNSGPQQSAIKIQKPSLKGQINNNNNYNQQQLGQSKKIIDPVQFAQAISAAALMSLKMTKAAQKRTSSEDNVNINNQQREQESIQHQSQKTRKNAPSLAGRSDSRGTRTRNSQGNGNSDSGMAKPTVQKGDSQQCSPRLYPEEFLKVNDDSQIKQRDKLISYIRNYIKKTNELPPTTLEFYKFIKLIGKGAFGKVTLGVHLLTGKYVAIKTIEKSFMNDEFSKKKVFQEVYLLKKIKHSNVIRLLEVFESEKHMLIVMEYAGGGDLLRLIKRKGKLDEGDTKYIFKQIVYGIAHIHCRSVIHRDIKLDNILLDSEKGVKICDFGVSKIIKKGQRIQEQCGTPAYLAPEIILDTGYEGFFVDIWSLGVLLYAMVTGTVPFKASNLEDLHKLILKGDFSLPSHVSQDAQEVLKGMIRLKPEERLTVPQILAHQWLKDTNDESESESEEEEDENKPQTPDNEMDLEKIQGNVNYVNVDNLFYNGLYRTKLSYTDYCCVTEDFATENIDEEALKVCENFGYPRSFVVKCLNRGDINHATACYFLLTNSL